MADRRREANDENSEDRIALIPQHTAEQSRYDHHLSSDHIGEVKDEVDGSTLHSEIGFDPKRSRPYKLERYLGRATVNTVGPLFVLSYYLFVVYEYLLRPAVNGVAPERSIGPRAVFFFWVIISIFLLDWAKSAIAGFEAAALMSKRWSPRTAIRLMWHLDRDWGSISGWWRALVYTYRYWGNIWKYGRKGDLHWDGPGMLWWYLALSSFLFYIAIPLSGLSMDPGDALRLSNQPVTIVGPNQTTFDVRSNPEVADLARNTWRQGLPTSPQSPTVFYAVDGTNNVSELFFEDTIQSMFLADQTKTPVKNRNVTYFSGPRVGDRVHGPAWGLWSSINCSPVNAYTGLQLINVSSFSDWSAPGLSSKTFNGTATLLSGYSSYAYYGLTPSMYFNDTAYGVSFQYIIATSSEALNYGPSYGSEPASPLPNAGSFEIVMWQQTAPGYDDDDDYVRMMTDPLVEHSEGYLGYGVRCEASSDVGFANLDAAGRTFSNFQRFRSTPPSDLFTVPFGGQIFNYPGVDFLQNVVFTALTKVLPGYAAPPACLPSSVSPVIDLMCSVFYSANLATGGVPYLVTATTSSGTGVVLRQACLSPARMTFAMYKVFGETAAAMMSLGPGNWTTTNLTGVMPTSDLVGGYVPWQIVLAFLFMWTLITVIPQLWTFTGKRWSSTLEPFELFRFGAEWRSAVQQFESNEAHENKILRQLPGLVGDMEHDKPRGFVGLSWHEAKREKEYINNRAEA